MKHKIFSFILLSLMFSCLFAGCSSSPKNYDITVQINGAMYGRVSDDVSGRYVDGTEVTISATPYEGQTFFCWLHDNKVVSIDSQYTFEVNEKNAGSYVALFKCPDLEFISLESFLFTSGVSNTGNDDLVTNLKSLTLSFGYTQNDLIVVYSSSNIADESDLSEDVSTLYAKDQFPYAYDKTRNIYINVETIYTRANLEYKSEKLIILNATQIGQEHGKIEDASPGEAMCITNDQLPALDGSANSQISITFKSLDSFEFKINDNSEA